MMIKVNDIFLDFNADIEIERKVKLFQNIDETEGDLSFAFNVELTSTNLTALGLPLPDSSSKRVYQVANTEILDENGVTVNKGSIRVERIIGRFASCSFLGGNSNWFAMLTGNMTYLELSDYDTDLTVSNVIASWDNTEGIVFPIIDTGTLITRGFPVFKTSDFVGSMFLHTMLKEVFKQSGLKIQGELIDDPFYKSLIVVTNTRSQRDVNNNQLYAGLSDDEVVGPLAIITLVFPNQTNPFYVGENIDIVGDEDFYVNAKMLIELEVSTTSEDVLLAYVTPEFLVNGAPLAANEFKVVSDSRSTSTAEVLKTTVFRFIVEDGDYITIIGTNRSNVQPTTLTSAYVKIRPLFIYKSFGNSAVPLWTKRDFVSNILQLFNTIVKYDEYTKTVTINLFDKIKEKENIDVSPYIQVDSIDYTEFISDFGKHNNFTYQEGDDEDLREYNISSFIKYGAGTIPADNDFLEESDDVVESDFTTPISYINPMLNASLERIQFVEFIEDNEEEITSVTDNGIGNARFHITDADDFYNTGDLVRLETDHPEYNGDFYVSGVASGYIDVSVLDFDVDATGTATRLTHKLTTDDSVFLMSVTKEIPNLDYSDRGGMFVETTLFTESAVAFFNIIRLGQPFEADYKQGLSFSLVNNQTSYQRTLLEKYWVQFGRVINDPVMLKTTGHLPWKVYNSIDFLRPITVRTLESSNQYYCNRIVGYKNRFTPCLIELIKLP
jgi:hypothetical protein